MTALGAHRQAHRDFLSSRRETGEEQIRDVRAGDEEHEAHRAEQKSQGGAQVAREFLGQGPQFGGVLGIEAAREGRSIALRQHLDLFVRLLEGDSRLQPRRGLHIGGTRVDLGRQQLRRRPGIGDEDLGVSEGIAQMGRQNADHGVVDAVQPKRRADRGFEAAEPGLPELVAHHRHRRRTGLVLFGGKGAPAYGLDAEDTEESFGDALSGELLGIGARARVGEAREGRTREFGERLLFVANQFVLRSRHRGRHQAVPGIVDPHAHQGVRVLEGVRPQDQLVEDGEEGRVGADGEGERQDRGGGEQGRLQELAASVGQQVHQGSWIIRTEVLRAVKRGPRAGPEPTRSRPRSRAGRGRRRLWQWGRGR